MKSKTAKFFCENCGNEVREDAKICTHCGKFFTNVRCPRCGFQGSSRQFKNGCPECGYSKDKNILKYTEKSPAESRKFFINFINKNYKNPSKAQKASSLPVWIYIFTISLFVVILVAFYSCLVS